MLIDFLGVGRCSSPSLGCCGEGPDSEEREERLVKRGEEADWRKANEDDGRREEPGVKGAFWLVGVGGPALLDRRSLRGIDRRFILMLKSSGSVLFVACEATDGDR